MSCRSRSVRSRPSIQYAFFTSRLRDRRAQGSPAGFLVRYGISNVAHVNLATAVVAFPEALPLLLRLAALWFLDDIRLPTHEARTAIVRLRFPKKRHRPRPCSITLPCLPLRNGQLSLFAIRTNRPLWADDTQNVAAGRRNYRSRKVANPGNETKMGARDDDRIAW
jgi:hypothetical protein